MAGAGGNGVTSNRTIYMGGLSVVVNVYNTRNSNDLADTVVRRINDMLTRTIKCVPIPLHHRPFVFQIRIIQYKGLAIAVYFG